MKKYFLNSLIGFLCIILLLLSAGCSKENVNNKDFATTYGGKPYKGDVRVELFENGTSLNTWNGDGRIAVIEAEADSVSIVFMADYGTTGEVNFKVRGKYDQMNYMMGDQQPSYFKVNGKTIDGKIFTADQNFNFTGTIENERVNMTMQVEFLKDLNGFKQGDRLDLNFNTTRDISEGNSTEGCQMRMVPIWSPNGMTMGMVPDC
jgi:hypothetical protein